MADLGAAVGGQYFMNKGDNNFDDPSEGDSQSDDEEVE